MSTGETDAYAQKLAMDRFVSKYNEIAHEASRAERDNNSAVNLHIQISGMISHFVKIYGSMLTRADVEFLRSECVARCMQALLLRSMELSGFGDLALSLSSTQVERRHRERASSHRGKS